MNLVPLWTSPATALATIGALLLAGCSAAGAPSRPQEPVLALRIDAPVHEPVWSDHARALVALTENDPRVAKIAPTSPPGSPSTAQTTLSEPLRDVGENVATSPTDASVVYVPQPRLDRVAVVSADNLRRVGTLQAGPSPSYVAEDSGSRMLLALSADGSTVTAVDLHGNELASSRKVQAGPEAEVGGGKRGRRIDYHLTGPGGIAHYKGGPSSVQKKGVMALPVETSTGDLVKSSRVYVAERGTDRLYAVDSRRSLHGLEVVARTSLDAPVRHLGVDERRVYAATEDELVVLETNSFEGYGDGKFTVVDTIDVRSALPSAELRGASLSGLAVGPDRVYLSLRDQPYVVSIAKPTI